MISIILNDWKIFLRNKLFLNTTIFFVLALFTVVILGTIQNNNQQLYRAKAQEHIQSQWENLEDSLPLNFPTGFECAPEL